MNRMTTTVFGLALIVLLCGTASAVTIYVPTDHTTIQAAVNNAAASDTIYVWNGTYNENVDIGTSHLTLAGEGADVVTVTAAATNDHVFNVTADYVNISGFNVTGATGSWYAGMHLNSADHCNISDNNASGNNHGIYLRDSCNNMLTGNDCSDNGEGIYLGGSSNNNTLTGNDCSGNVNTGICLGGSSNNNTLTGNNCTGNGDEGIRLFFSSGNTLTGNDCSGNLNKGIYLACSSDNNTLTGNNCSDTSCSIYLYDSSDNNTLTENICLDHCSYGIVLLRYSSGNTIERNMIENRIGWGTGVHVDDSSNYTEIHENCFIDNVPQASDDGTGNNWTGNFWYPPPGGLDYNISGSAGSEDTEPLDVCPLTGPPAALNLSKTDDVDGCVDVGDTITYTICYDNLANSVAMHDVVIIDTLPSGVIFDSASHGGTHTAGVATWAIGNLAAGAMGCVTLNVTVNAGTGGTTLENCATIKSDETEPTTACEDTVVCTAGPTPPAPLNLSKTDDVDGCVDVGDTITYTICYDNLANSVAVHNVVITDTLPSGVTFDSASHGGTHAAGVVTWTIGNLAAGATGCVTLNVTVDAGTEGQPLTNCATIESDETEPAEACETTDVCTAEPTPTPTPYPTPVPALTPLGMTLLIGLMLVAGFMTMRRRE